MKYLLAILLVLVLATPASAAGPDLPTGYSVREMGKVMVTIVNTPGEGPTLLDALVVLSVAEQQSSRGISGLVVGCSAMTDNTCRIVYMATSTPRRTIERLVMVVEE